MDAAKNIGDMNEKIEAFSLRCKKMPTRLREYTAYKVRESMKLEQLL